MTATNPAEVASIAASMHSSADSDRPLVERLDLLLAQMSVEEKVAQLVAVDVEQLITDQQLDPDKLAAELGNGCAAFTGLADFVMADVEAYRNIVAELTEFLTSHSRLGIPAWICETPLSLEPLVGVELTVHPLAMAASFAPAQVTHFASRYRSACRDLAVDQILGPSLSVDVQAGRFSAGADAYLAGRMAVAFLRGMHGDSPADCVLACAGGFVAQSLQAAEPGSADSDKNRVRVGRRELREVYAEPYAAAIREAGLAAVVVADLTIDGVPTVGAREVLGDLLRDNLGYRGLVISVEGGIRNLVERHRVAGDLSEAAIAALTAGTDIDLTDSCFREELPVAVADGSVSEETLDRAVRRVLQCKLQSGLFDRAAVADAGEVAEQSTLTPPFEASAASLHEAGSVLLTNAGEVLPLAKGSMLRVAESSGGLLISALRAQDFNVSPLSLDEAAASPSASDGGAVAIVCFGAVAASSAPAVETRKQLQLLDELAEQRIPAVVILNADALDYATRLTNRAAAILIAWDFSLGSMRAAAGVLSGAVNPSGRLPLALPAVTASASDTQGFCFGHGLSYSHFEYRELHCPDTVDTHGAVEVAIEVVNESTVGGVEVVQLYCQDPVAETSRPERQLIGFHRLALAAGQSKRVIFQLDVSQFAYYNRRLEYVVEPGVIVLIAGASRRDIRARARLSVEGDVRVFKQQQRLATQSRDLELSP